MLELYHYTTEKCKEKILQEGVIRRTSISDTDALFGKGVYLTEMNPDEFEKDEIAKNNWGPNGYRKKMRQGNADSYVKVSIPEKDRNIIKCPSGDRNVFLYKDNLMLSDDDQDSGRNSDWKKGLAIAAGVTVGALAVGVGLAWLGSYLTNHKCENCDQTFGDTQSLEQHKRFCRN